VTRLYSIIINISQLFNVELRIRQRSRSLRCANELWKNKRSHLAQQQPPNPQPPTAVPESAKPTRQKRRIRLSYLRRENKTRVPRRELEKKARAEEAATINSADASLYVCLERNVFGRDGWQGEAMLANCSHAPYA
jgi:hypothetical protein